MSQIQLLTAVSAANGKPSGATAGVALPHYTDRALLLIDAAVTGATVGSVTAKLWGYNSLTAKWYPLGIDATAANKGLINGGAAIGETDTDIITHAEEVTSIMRLMRVYLELTVVSNIASLNAYLDCAPCSATSGG